MLLLFCRNHLCHKQRYASLETPPMNGDTSGMLPAPELPLVLTWMVLCKHLDRSVEPLVYET